LGCLARTGRRRQNEAVARAQMLAQRVGDASHGKWGGMYAVSHRGLSNASRVRNRVRPAVGWVGV